MFFYLKSKSRRIYFGKSFCIKRDRYNSNDFLICCYIFTKAGPATEKFAEI